MDTEEASSTEAPQRTIILNKDPFELAVTPVDHGIAAMERQLIGLGVPLEIMARMMMQHAASICALIEPPSVRAEVMRKLIGNFPAQVRVAQVAASTTPNGVIVPPGAAPTGKPI